MQTQEPEKPQNTIPEMPYVTARERGLLSSKEVYQRFGIPQTSVSRLLLLGIIKGVKGTHPPGKTGINCKYLLMIEEESAKYYAEHIKRPYKPRRKKSTPISTSFQSPPSTIEQKIIVVMFRRGPISLVSVEDFWKRYGEAKEWMSKYEKQWFEYSEEERSVYAAYVRGRSSISDVCKILGISLEQAEIILGSMFEAYTDYFFHKKSEGE